MDLFIDWAIRLKVFLSKKKSIQLTLEFLQNTFNPWAEICIKKLANSFYEL